MSKTHINDRFLTIDNILTNSECLELINNTEKRGYKPSPISGGGHGNCEQTPSRTSQFIVYDDIVLSSYLWSKIQSFVPQNLRSIKPVSYLNSITKGDEFIPVSVNEHIRFYKYDIGQYIKKHDDYRMSRYRYDNVNNKYYYQMTFFTVLIYLNDNFENGTTNYWKDETKSNFRFLTTVKNQEPDIIIQPKTGMASITDHVIKHEGIAPQKNTKYILRTDIIHEREIQSNIIPYKFKKNELLSKWTRHFEPSCLNYSE